MAEIAGTVGMSKRTLYANYDDKNALFKAAVNRAVARYTIPIDVLKNAQKDDLEKTLTEVARIRIDNISTPTGIKLQRILATQSYRFPEMFNAAFDIGAGPTIDFLAELFEQNNASGVTDVGKPRQAAIAFLSLVVGGPARLIIAGGQQISAEEMESRVKFSIELFLNGVRKR